MRVPLCLLLSTALLACEEDTLHQNPDPPDGGAPPAADAAPRDASARDATAAPDAEPWPDAAPPPPPPAREPIYIHTGTELYSFDPDTRTSTLIGTFRSGAGDVADMVDIAIDLDGRMYGGSIDQQIFLVDPGTARCTLLSTYDDRLNGMTFVSDGRFIVAGDRVSVVDPSTGRQLRELVPPGRFTTSGDIVGLPDGYLYWTVREASGGDGLVRIDPDTGETTHVGSGSVDRIFGLGFAYDVLYGFSTRGVSVVIDRASGRVMSEAMLDGRWYGATTNPVLWE